MSKRFLEIILLLFLFNGSLGQRGALSKNTCKDNPELNNEECFTDIIKFDNFRAGHSVISANGDLIIEYSRNSNHSERLFYGIKHDGSYYFPDNSFIKVINLTEDGLGRPRYESINYILVEEGAEYLFSVSISCVELYRLETLENLNTIDQYKFDQVKFYPGYKKKYRGSLTYIYGANFFINSIGYKLSLFYFNEQYGKIGNVFNIDIRITFFPVDDDKYLILIRLDGSFLKIQLLNEYFEFSEIEIDFESNYIEKVFDNSNIFYKAIPLSNNIFAFVCLNDYTDNKFILTSYTSLLEKPRSFDNKYEWDFDSYLLNPDPFLSDFIEYNNYSLALISNKNLGNIIEIFLFYLNENYDGIKVNHYSYSLNNYILNKDVSATYWNNYLVFIPSYSNTNSAKMHSFLLIFGFANGTNSTIDISPYLNDTDNKNSNNNLVTELLNYLIIDNNIFGYKTTGEVILNKIPDELSFYKIDGDIQKQIEQNTIININDTIEINQKKDIIKTNILYSIEYQFIIKSTEDMFDSMAHSQYKDSNYNNLFDDLIYYSRKYISSFKLCYKNCGTCKELGISYYNQKSKHVQIFIMMII